MNTKKIILLLVSALMLFSCSQEKLLESPVNEKEEFLSYGSRGFGKVYGLDEINSFSDKFFSTGSNGYLRAVNKSWLKGYYVNMQGQGDGQYTPDHVSTNEAMGYGMRLAAYRVATATTRSDVSKWRNIFDGLWRVQHYFPSQTDSRFHSWVIPADFKKSTTQSHYCGSATDGELDIAYSLLLMDKLVGSSGEFNYRAQADEIIIALSGLVRKESAGGKDYYYLLTGDWTKDDSKAKYVTRSSDFMPHHLKTFMKYLESNGKKYSTEWYSFKNNLDTIQYWYANNPFSSKGLFPDFIKLKGGIIEALKPTDPAAIQLGEEVATDLYSHNASRVPWRMAEDTYFTDDEVTAKAASRIYYTLKDHEYGDLFDLNGNPQNDHTSACFSAPVSACIEPAFYLQYKSLTNGYAKGACGNAYWRTINEAFNRHNSFFQGQNHPWGPGYFEDAISLFSQYFMLRNIYMIEPYDTSGI